MNILDYYWRIILFQRPFIFKKLKKKFKTLIYETICCFQTWIFSSFSTFYTYCKWLICVNLICPYVLHLFPRQQESEIIILSIIINLSNEYACNIWNCFIFIIVYSVNLKVLTIILFSLGVWCTSLIMPNTNYDILMTDLSSMALECALYHRNNKTMTNGAQMLVSSGRGTTLPQQWKGKQMVSVNSMK